MPHGMSPRSKTRLFRKITLPAEVKTYFAKHGSFLRGLPTYDQVRGRDTLPISREVYDKKALELSGTDVPLYDVYPITHATAEGEAEANEKARELVAAFTGVGKSRVNVRARSYMLSGGTLPIRLDISVDGKKNVVYAKMPSIERIVGLSFLNLLTPLSPIRFAFSEYVFVEDEVCGYHPTQRNMRPLADEPRFQESLARLRILDDFLSITDLDRWIVLTEEGRVENTLVNILVSPALGARPFDLDCMFRYRFPEYGLLGIFKRDFGVNYDPAMVALIKADEKERIRRIIKTTHKDHYRELIRLFNQVPNLLVDERGRNIGYDNVGAFFEFKEAWLTNEKLQPERLRKESS